MAAKSDCVLYSRYIIKHVLGDGHFCIAYLAEDQWMTNVPLVAIKVLHAGLAELGIAESETLTMLSKADKYHQFGIIELMRTFWAGPHLCLVLEYLPAPIQVGPEYDKKWTIDEIGRLAFDLFTTAYFLHEHNSLIHADIKPENVRVINSIKGYRAYKLIDYGNALIFSKIDSYLKNFDIQSLNFRAPEVLCGVSIDEKVDIWSIGYLLLCAMTAASPFAGSTRDEILPKMIELLGPLPDTYEAGIFMRPNWITARKAPIQKDGRFWKHWRQSNLSRLVNSFNLEFLEFLDGLLCFEPAIRLSAKKALLHPFMRPFGLFIVTSETTSAKRHESRAPENITSALKFDDADLELSAIISSIEDKQRRKRL